MDRFKFRAPSTSTNQLPAIHNVVEKPKNVPANEDLWDDDIDEETLLQASQIMELEPPNKFNFAAIERKRGDRIEIDPSTLSEMIPKTDDEDIWETDKLFRGQNKFNQTQTVFGDESERLKVLSKGRQPFQNSFNEPATKPLPSKAPMKPFSQRIIVSSGVGATAEQSTEQASLGLVSQDQVEKLKTENLKLTELHHIKAGQISNLKAEIDKRQRAYDKEKEEMRKKYEQKIAQMEEIEKKKNQEIESLKSERDFTKIDLFQANEKMDRLEKKQKETSRIGLQSQQPQASASLKRPSMPDLTQSSSKKPRYGSNIDESFFEESSKTTKFYKPTSKDSFSQTAARRRRKYQLAIEAETGDLVSKIGSLAGSLSLATLSESESLTLNSGKCFNLYCLSALAHHDKLIKLSGEKTRLNMSVSNNEEEGKIVKRIISDLSGALVIASQLSRVDRNNPNPSVPEIESEALKSVVRIMTNQSLSENETLLNTATSLLCSILESGCLEDKTVRELLDEFKLISIELDTKDGDPLDFPGKKIDMMTNLLTVLASMSLYHASTLCSDSKDSCFNFFLWNLIEQVTCGDMTNSEKEDATQTKVTSKIKNLLNLESLEPSLSLQLAVAFVTWISSVLPSDNVSWIGFKFSSSLPSDGKEPVKLRFVKCRWCLNDLLKSLAAITWSLVSECAEFIAHGLTPPAKTFEIVHSCLVCLHIFWSWDPSAFAKALAESPGIQRRYIWTTRQLNSSKQIFNFDASEGDILGDLSVECDEGDKNRQRKEDEKRSC